MGAHRDIDAALAGTRGRDIVLDAVAANLAQVLRTRLPPSADAPLPRDLAIAHVASTFLCVLRWWLDRHPALPWQEADALFRELVLSGLAKAWPESVARPHTRQRPARTGRRSSAA